MQNTDNQVIKKIRQYKRKFYTNLLIRGAIWSIALVLVVFLTFSFAEYLARFNSTVRAGLFFGFILLALSVLYMWIIRPMLFLFNIQKPFSDEEAAKQIGKHFPEVNDKLLNVLQLRNVQTTQHNALIQASIYQKETEFAYVPFTKAINYSENNKYLQYLGIPLVIILAIVFIKPDIFTSSTERIVKYKQEFVPQAPFHFSVLNQNLRAFRNEDFILQLGFEGDAIPDNAYLLHNGRRVKMQKAEAGVFTYTFNKVQDNKDFSFEAAGFLSSDYQLEVVQRPNLRGFNILLKYPSYLNKKNERLENVGNFQVPEGTTVGWMLSTLQADSLKMIFGNEDVNSFYVPKDQALQIEKQIMKSQDYEVRLYNQWSANKEKIQYHIDVIPDQYPNISLDQYQDTTLYNFIVLGGNIADDYGLNQLKLYYRLISGDNKGQLQSVTIPINRSQLSQSYYYRWELDSINIKQGDKLEYYLQVWDNDGVNGSKSSKTSTLVFKVPSAKEIKENISKAERNTESQLDKNIQKAESQKERIQKAEERLRGKNKLNYRDEKILQELIEERKKIEEALKELKEKNKELQEQQERFNQQKDEKIKEKAEQLQKLMDELLDEETKKLYEELQKLLEENKNSEQIQDILEKLNNKEENLEKELERALELFKRMKFDSKLEQTIKELEELSEKQEKLSEETGEKENKGKEEELLQKQEELNKEFNDAQEDLKELQKLNQDLKNPNPMQDMNQEQQEIQQQQQESKESLEQGKNKKAQKAQKNAAQQMKQMTQKMQQMQSSMEMEMLQENLDNLRDIVDNLVKLSFDQETLMKEFREVNQSNPRYVDLGQQQLKLRDDAAIIEDSLRALAERVFQIQAFVTREMNDMNKYMDESVDAIKERKKGEAVGKQQFAMTSMNNLALLLDDVLQQMQQQMADAMGNPKAGKQKQKGQGAPNLSELQQQLNNKIDQLRKSGKTGRELSEELARMAAEQEKIREALKEMEEKLGKKDGGKPGTEGIQKKMEETEMDLVNKKITEETIKRQRDILTRLLEAENAMREREMDDERKGESAKDYEKRVPKAFEEYLKQKEKEIELLKSVPPKLNPYYKKEVNKYFKKLGLQD